MTDTPDAAIERMHRRYLLAFGNVMQKERGVPIDVCLSALMAAYGELIAKCSAPGRAVETVKAMADALKLFAETNAPQLEDIAVTNKEFMH